MQESESDKQKTYQPAKPLYGGTGQPTAAPSASDETRHAQSVRQYPDLNLSKGEYVIESVRRHPIGMLSIWFSVIFLIVLILALLSFYAMNQAVLENVLRFTLPTAAVLSIPAFLLVVMFGLGGFIATVVYERNHFYLTNESVIQHVSTSLFHTQSQIINLVNVEDASFEQKGILQQVLNYGTIRLSTQGQETIYHFYFVSNPQRVINSVNDAVEEALKKIERGGVGAHKVIE
jgi:hypothetical protein